MSSDHYLMIPTYAGYTISQLSVIHYQQLGESKLKLLSLLISTQNFRSSTPSCDRLYPCLVLPTKGSGQFQFLTWIKPATGEPSRSHGRYLNLQRHQHP
ncbi:unnamed protein product [Linum trigynum]|uniref:Uncharacterized protein n=1 Tax=Linum trigynum TaxID=586398 RepID=A0AAV2CUT0_9ROSI